VLTVDSVYDDGVEVANQEGSLGGGGDEFGLNQGVEPCRRLGTQLQ